MQLIPACRQQAESGEPGKGDSADPPGGPAEDGAYAEYRNPGSSYYSKRSIELEAPQQSDDEISDKSY
ncbi:hypothetical protein D3C75_1258840 [compost metagenome]